MIKQEFKNVLTALFVLILLSAALAAVSGCSSNRMPPSNQPLEQARADLSLHVMKGNLNQNFCEGKGFSYYSETALAYSFRCSSYTDERGQFIYGGWFSLPKSEM